MEWKNQYKLMLNDSSITYNEINTFIKNHIPGKLYRYRNYGINWEDELKKGQIYMTMPSEFNDPFDCTIYINKNEFEYLVKSKLYPYFPDNYIDNNISSNYNKNYDKYRKGFWDITRLACFTTNYKSILMWSHYAGKHQGYCIEYDTSRINSKLLYLFPVAYDKKRYDATQFLISKNSNLFMNPLLYKAEEWIYEDEWRLLATTNEFNEKKGEYFIADRAISAIYLGIESDRNTNVKAIIDWAKDNNIPVYKMRVSKTQYALIKEPI